MGRNRMLGVAGTARRACLPLVLAAALVATLMVHGASPAEAAAKNCNKVSGFVVKVTKGAVKCKQARRTMRRFVKGDGGRNCGTAMRPACVIGRFHCRVAMPGESGRTGRLRGYCYRLKNPVPAARDFSYYKPKNFKAAITLNAQERKRRHKQVKFGYGG